MSESEIREQPPQVRQGWGGRQTSAPDFALLIRATLKGILARAASWPAWTRQDLADLADEIDREVAAGTCRATRQELARIDEALAAVRRGEVASEAEVEAVFAKQRRI